MDKLATLDQDGVLNSPAKIADRLMAYFFTSDYSQTRALYGSIASLPKCLQDNMNNPQGLCDSITGNLSKLFEPYFTTVALDVTYKDRDVVDGLGSNHEYDVYVHGILTRGDMEYNLSKLLSISNNKFRSVSELQV